MKKILILLIIVISASSWAIASILLWKNEQNKEINNLVNLENNITSLVKKTSNSVVSIVIKKDLDIFRNDPWGFFQYKVGSIEKKVWGGTGFFISKDWIIITNKHVVADRNANYTVILNSWEEYDADIIAVKKWKDIAFLKIKSNKNNFIPLKFIENKSKIKIWQFAIWITQEDIEKNLEKIKNK